MTWLKHCWVTYSTYPRFFSPEALRFYVKINHLYVLNISVIMKFMLVLYYFYGMLRYTLLCLKVDALFLIEMLENKEVSSKMPACDLREKCLEPLQLALESRAKKLSVHVIAGLQVKE